MRSIFQDMKPNTNKGTENDCRNLRGAEIVTCPICNGSGRVITGYSVICTEIVEKVEKCPECREGLLGPRRKRLRELLDPVLRLERGLFKGADPIL
jgi:hypothetical protein